jgi:hypothetical protein
MKISWLKPDEASQNIVLSSRKILMKTFVSVCWLRTSLSVVVLRTACPVLLCVVQISVCVCVCFFYFLLFVLDVLLWCHELGCMRIQGVSNKAS